MENLRAAELRIGNYYNQFGNIEQVSWSVLKKLEDAPTDQLWCKPIPLSENWLLGFGAKELKPKKGIAKEFTLKTVRIEMSNSGKFYYKNSKIPLDAVHQLQNLYFALRNEELIFQK